MMPLETEVAKHVSFDVLGNDADSVWVSAAWAPSVDPSGIAGYDWLNWRTTSDSVVAADATVYLADTFAVALPPIGQRYDFGFQIRATDGVGNVGPYSTPFHWGLLVENPADTIGPAPPDDIYMDTLIIIGGVIPPPQTDSLAPDANDLIIFQDGFESGNLNAWTLEGGEASYRYGVTTNPVGVRTGIYAMQVTFRPNPVDYGEAYRHFMPGYDEVYISFDVKFEDGFEYPSGHFLGFEGNRTDDPWSASGQSGVCSNGTNFFQSIFEPQGLMSDPSVFTHPWMFYTYWTDMSSEYGCFGNFITQSTPRIAPVEGQWQHVVIHVKLNDIGQYNGFQRAYIDGVRKIDHSGLRWRTSTILRLNEFIVYGYMAEAAGFIEHAWIDNVIVWQKQ